MKRVGVIKFVQIQRDHLKEGEEPNRVYRPDPILVVDQLQLTCDGIMGVTEKGEMLIDVHHVQHPRSRYRGDNKISFGFLQHYDAIRSTFGSPLENGHAGENMILDAEVDLDVLNNASKVFIQHGADLIELVNVIPAPPCRPFSEFCAGKKLDAPDMKAALQFLSDGRRGYYAELTGSPCMVTAGDVLMVE